MIVEWINLRFGLALSEEQLSSVKEFSLIWNVFEDVVCSNSFSIDAFEQAIAGKNFNISDFEKALKYFKNRYIDGGATNARFDQLHFRNNDRKDFVKDVLLGNLVGDKEIILALTIIVYRFRNNLFHGLKDIRVIHEQKDNFEHANFFLTQLLKYFP